MSAEKFPERNAEIVRRRKAGEWPRAIACSLGLSANTVIGVCNRAGLSGPDGKAEVLRGEEQPNAKLSAALIVAARARYKPRSRTDGLRAMAAEIGVNPSTLQNAVSGARWKHIA